ncbi:hypothetical protein ABPG75_006847 [Micractinium tetrahymenae]
MSSADALTLVRERLQRLGQPGRHHEAVSAAVDLSVLSNSPVPASPELKRLVLALADKVAGLGASLERLSPAERDCQLLAATLAAAAVASLGIGLRPSRNEATRLAGAAQLVLRTGSVHLAKRTAAALRSEQPFLGTSSLGLLVNAHLTCMRNTLSLLEQQAARLLRALLLDPPPGLAPAALLSAQADALTIATALCFKMAACEEGTSSIRGQGGSSGEAAVVKQQRQAAAWELLRLLPHLLAVLQAVAAQGRHVLAIASCFRLAAALKLLHCQKRLLQPCRDASLSPVASSAGVHASL